MIDEHGTGNGISRDVLVAGSGPAGLIAALAFTRRGFSVDLAGPAPQSTDTRTTALMEPALAFLGELGLSDELASIGAPLRTMRIVDATSRLIRSPTVTFRAAEIERDRFGLNLPNRDLNRILASAVEAAGIAWHRHLVTSWAPAETAIDARLSDGTHLAARLAVAADGRHSPARAAAGIRMEPRPTGQSALALSFSHDRHHEFTSTEFHTETGPCTQVPLPGGRRSSLVWVGRSAEVDALLGLDRSELARRIEAALSSMLGPVEVEGDVQAYPLSAALPRRFAHSRIALVGEAAHVLPPIGAQGLNLGIRDVEQLVAVAGRHSDDPGAPAALEAYEASRRPDILARSGAVNLLNRSLLSDFLPAQFARSLVFETLRSFGPARAFFMNEGMQPGSGVSAFLRSWTDRRPAGGRS